MNDPDIEYLHFTPSQELQNEIERRLRRAIEKLPAGSDLEAVIVDRGHTYLFSAIAKVGASFFSSDLDMNPKIEPEAEPASVETMSHMMRLVLEDLHRQISAWERNNQSAAI